LTTQILNFSDEQLKDLAEELIAKGHVILYDQVMTMDQYVEVCNRIGNCEYYNYFMNPPERPEVSLVSGERDENGKVLGVFGDSELQWHANGVARHKFDQIIVSLYCVEECVDTVLSICNWTDMFADLSEEQKDYYRSIDVHLDGAGVSLWPNSNYRGREGEFNVSNEYYKEVIQDDDKRPLVGKHPIDGREYLYFLIQYLKEAYIGDKQLDIDEFYADLWPKVFRSKYMFHHVFRRGDLLFMDQLHTIHRRSPIHFMDRMLWRTAFDYSNIKF
jgi:alpha-ketoglutarate-dependent taurine dioxygenase